ncbi:MAG: hypothetical protein RR064_04000 [Oscillospiraceae bacterium]
MKKIVYLIMIIINCGYLLFCAGCAKQSDEAQWNANCKICVDNLPQEYNDLPDEIKQSTRFSISLSNASTDKRYMFELTEENEYSEEIGLLPGTYTVSNVNVYNSLLPQVTASTLSNTLEIKSNTNTTMNVSVSNPENLSQLITKNKVSDEILNENIYSRKVQYGGTVYDMQTMMQEMEFNNQNEKNVMPSETAYIASKSHSGISMIVQNTNESGFLPPSQCEFIGFRFYDMNSMLPSGLTVGLPVEKIANAKSGILGTPDYCLGTPLIGMDFDNTTLVFLDKQSGDRISVELNSSKGYVQAISYEFNRYQ